MPPYGIGQAIIFSSCGFLLLSSSSSGITGLPQRAPPIFGWAAMTLGIGPHSSFGMFSARRYSFRRSFFSITTFFLEFMCNVMVHRFIFLCLYATRWSQHGIWNLKIRSIFGFLAFQGRRDIPITTKFGVDEHSIHCESKKSATLTMAITLSVLGRFAKFFRCCKKQ